MQETQNLPQDITEIVVGQNRQDYNSPSLLAAAASVKLVIFLLFLNLRVFGLLATSVELVFLLLLFLFSLCFGFWRISVSKHLGFHGCVD
jgi:hypothetical protein